jgi:hypothetical protein
MAAEPFDTSRSSSVGVASAQATANDASAELKRFDSEPEIIEAVSTMSTPSDARNANQATPHEPQLERFIWAPVRHMVICTTSHRSGSCESLRRWELPSSPTRRPKTKTLNRFRNADLKGITCRHVRVAGSDRFRRWRRLPPQQPRDRHRSRGEPVSRDLQYQAGFYGLSTAGSVVLFLVVTVIVVALTWWLNRGEEVT